MQLLPASLCLRSNAGRFHSIAGRRARALAAATYAALTSAALTSAALTSAALLSTGCSPGFFAREVSVIPAAAPVLEDDAITTGPGETNGLGCSPKGCLPTPAEFVVADGGPPERSGRNMSARSAANLANHPLRGKSAAEIARMVKTDLPSLGSMSFGNSTRGGLLNATHMPEDPRWTLVEPGQTWGTAETVSYLVTALDAVFKEFPDSHSAFIGDISRQRGGYLKPHLSHQSGKDVDLGYFYTTKAPVWYTRATAYNLDRARTWAFIRALIAQTDVHMIFIDRRVQRLLRSYAESIGEDPGWLHSIFDGNETEESMIRHEPGHDTHFHVRFYNPIAEETARRCYSALLEQKKLLPMRYNITHRVKKGETLIGLGKRYGMTPGAIMRANGLKSSSIMANKTYFIPQNGPAAPSAPVTVPPRRVPPPRASTGPVASLHE